MKKNQKNYQNKNEKNNDPLMETINRLFPEGKEMTAEDIDIIMDMIVNMSPVKRTPEELFNVDDKRNRRICSYSQNSFTESFLGVVSTESFTAYKSSLTLSPE